MPPRGVDTAQAPDILKNMQKEQNTSNQWNMYHAV